MLFTPLRILIFVVAALVAAVGTAYIAGAFDPYLRAPSATVAGVEESGAEGKSGRLPAGEEAGEEKPADEGAPASQAGDADAPSGGEPAGEASTADGAADETASGDETAPTGETAAGVVVPVFDVVRVEPDGSMVVAGRAAPDANVEVVAGATIVGTTKSGPQGDFAVVLDEPLEPGDYQIVLRSTAPGNVVATSKETAVVSVPDSEKGDVLALVEEPGKPSRLITVPKGTPPAGDADAAAAGEGNASAGQGADEQAASAGQRPADEDGDDTGSSGPQAATTEQAAPDEGAGDEAAAGAGSDAASATAEASQQTVAPDPRVNIEAVEIDGRQIFVAGSGAPGKRVRVYANDILLGDAMISPAGRFLVEATRDLAVGDYIVRADLLSEKGSDVIARAAVPFAREPGEKLSAVAPQPSPQPAGDGAESGEAASSGGAAGTHEQEAADGDGKTAAAAGEGSVVLPDLDSRIASEPPVITEPRLETVDGAVIIRRGDTLWHISRRVYGHGIRYSTIYLANQGQIRDPDLIWPGQVFTVPEKTDEGDVADMTAIGDQAMPAPAAQD